MLIRVKEHLPRKRSGISRLDIANTSSSVDVSVAVDVTASSCIEDRFNRGKHGLFVDRGKNEQCK